MNLAELKSRAIERGAANVILKVCPLVTLFALKIPFTRKEWKLRMSMRRPKLSGMVFVDYLYLGMGVTHEQMLSFTPEQRAKFNVTYARDIAKIAAMYILGGMASYKCWGWLLWRLIYHCSDEDAIFDYVKAFRPLLQTRAFENTIKSAQEMRLLKPRLSQS